MWFRKKQKHKSDTRYDELKNQLVESETASLKEEEYFTETFGEPLETEIKEDSEEEEYEVIEREILPENIICPDCGGITLRGLEFCDKCGGELSPK